MHKTSYALLCILTSVQLAGFNCALCLRVRCAVHKIQRKQARNALSRVLCACRRVYTGTQRNARDSATLAPELCLLYAVPVLPVKYKILWVKTRAEG